MAVYIAQYECVGALRSSKMAIENPSFIRWFPPWTSVRRGFSMVTFDCQRVGPLLVGQGLSRLSPFPLALFCLRRLAVSAHCICMLQRYTYIRYLHTYIYMYISNIHRTLETVQMISHTHWWPCSRWRVLPHGVAKIGGHDVPSDAKSRRGTLQSRALLGHWLHFWSETCIGCWYFCRFNGV